LPKRDILFFGKYDQFRKDVPYSAIIQSFQGSSGRSSLKVKKRFRAGGKNLLTLWANGKVITDVIPELEMVIHKQPELPALGPEESMNRFNLVFQNLSTFLHRKNTR